MGGTGLKSLRYAGTGTGATFEVADAPRFVRASGPAAPVLTEGHRLVDGDLTCAVTTGTTSCVTGSPAAHWFVLSADGSGIGPSTPGLPAGFPDLSQMPPGLDELPPGLADFDLSKLKFPGQK